MEKKKKRDSILIVMICVAAVILVIIGGVWTASRIAHSLKVRHNRVKSHDDEYVQAQMMDYLEDRYHEKFVMKYYSQHLGGTWNGNYVVMGAWPEGKEDGMYFTVTGYPDAEGNLGFYDTYASDRVDDEMRDYFKPYIVKYYGEYLSYSTFFYWSSFSSEVPADISLEEMFAQKAKAELALWIDVEQQEMDSNLENLESLAKELQNHKFRGKFLVVLCDIESHRGYWEYDFHISDEEIEMTEEAY